MGLFSFLGKNRQERTAEDSGRFISRAEDGSLGERARAKRASHAGEGARRGRDGKGAPDPALPEKKRARRRLVGAIALALAAAVGLPMLLDSAPPKSSAGDIAIEIPAKDKAAPMPAPADPGAKPDAVPAAESVDKGEEIVDPSKAAAPKPAADRQQVTEVNAAKPQASLTAHASVAAPSESKPEHKTEPKAESRLAEKAARKAPAKAEDKRASEEAARALAILNGKEADKPRHDDGERFVQQVAALGSAEKASELQAKLSAAGLRSFTEKVARPGGELIRVKVGPYGHDEADKVRAKLAKLHLNGG
jgi:DedD protein